MPVTAEQCPLSLQHRSWKVERPGSSVKPCGPSWTQSRATRSSPEPPAQMEKTPGDALNPITFVTSPLHLLALSYRSPHHKQMQPSGVCVATPMGADRTPRSRLQRPWMQPARSKRSAMNSASKQPSPGPAIAGRARKPSSTDALGESSTVSMSAEPTQQRTHAPTQTAGRGKDGT